LKSWSTGHSVLFKKGHWHRWQESFITYFAVLAKKWSENSVIDVFTNELLICCISFWERQKSTCFVDILLAPHNVRLYHQGVTVTKFENTHRQLLLYFIRTFFMFH
jgi:hypothetical protein